MDVSGSIVSNNTGAINGSCEYVPAWKGNKCPNLKPSDFVWTILGFEVILSEAE